MVYVYARRSVGFVRSDAPQAANHLWFMDVPAVSVSTHLLARESMHDTHPLRELTQRREEREAEGAEYESAEGERESLSWRPKPATDA